MTKEELEKEAEDFESRKHYRYEDNDYCGDIADGIVQAYLAGAEPREKRIAELEQRLEQTEKDLTDYQFNYPKIKDLEKEKCELLGIIQGKDKAIKDFEWQLKEVLEDNDNYQKENAELKEINEGYNRNRDKLIAMGFPTFKSCKEYSDKLTNLQKENATLKKQLEALSGDIPWNKLKDVSEVTTKLTEAKEIIKDLLTLPFANNWEVYADVTSHLDRAEQFLKDSKQEG